LTASSIVRFIFGNSSAVTFATCDWMPADVLKTSAVAQATPSQEQI